MVNVFMDVETVRHYGFLGIFITEAMFIIALLRATIFVICKCNAIGVAIVNTPETSQPIHIGASYSIRSS